MTAWARVGALLILAMLVGCTAASPNGPDPDTSSPVEVRPSYQRYVALGDSYTAAPYVPTTDLADGCLRSNGNYPSLVAERLDIATLVDVSCSAAVTKDLRHPQVIFRGSTVSAQFDALTPDTDLVTLGIGGNDFTLFGTLLRTCTRLSGADRSGAPCTESLAATGTNLDVEIDKIGSRIAAALDQIQRRSPEARVLLVGYPPLVPDHGACPKLLPLATGDYELAAQLGRSLDEAMSRAAQSTGVDFIEMYAASRGHDVCSSDPWVNGRVTDRSAALAYHPFATEMAAVTGQVVTLLESQ